MKILDKDIKCDNAESVQTVYKAAFTTDEGVIHRVDFNDAGRIKNLCEYAAHTPNIHINDLKTLINKIEAAITV